MSGRKKVLENSFFYTLSSLLVKAVSFLLLPIYTRFLSPEDYGITNLVTGFNGVATFVISFSLFAAIVRFIPEYKEDRSKLKRLFSTLIIFVFITGFLFSILGILFRNFLVDVFFENIPFFPYVLIGLLTLTFSSLHTIHQSIMRGFQQGKKLSIINLIISGLQVSLNLFFVIILRLDALGVLLASLIINFGYLFFMLFDLKKNNLVSICLDTKLLVESLRYSIPLLPHNLSTHIASFTSKVLLNTSGALFSVGLFGVASQFGLIVDTVQSSVNAAFTPWFYDVMANNKNGEYNVEILELSQFLLISYSFLYLFIGLFSQEVIILFTSTSYTEAWTAIPILVMAYSIKSIYYFFVNILFYYKELAKKIFFASMTGSFSNILFSFLLIPKFGMYGAATAFLISKIVTVSIVVVLSRKHNIVGYRVLDMIKIVLPSLLFMGTGLILSYSIYPTAFNWNNFIYKLVILLVYIFYAYLTNKLVFRKIYKSEKIQTFIGYYMGRR